MTVLSRRQLLRYGASAVAFASATTMLSPFVLAKDDEVTSGDPEPGVGGGDVEVDLTIQDVDYELIDGSTVFMYAFCINGAPPRIPGPVLRVREGRKLTVSLTNLSSHAHSFQVPGMSGSAIETIAPNASATIAFTVGKAGTYFYLDPKFSPVNRILGLHGALVVEPDDDSESSGAKMPYNPADATPAIKALFNSFGASSRFPGSRWDKSREKIWIFNQIDARWCQRAANGEIDAVAASEFANDFRPRYFTLNGLCGIDACHDKDTCPTGRIGEPLLLRCLNAGLACHSPHIHGNHVFMLSESKGASGIISYSSNVIERDVWRMESGTIQDCLLPFTAPPDVPPGAWPPKQEKFPLRYPMHCHNEISQTAAGGSYPMGLVTDWHIDGL
jgi:Multicopper oxidase